MAAHVVPSDGRSSAGRGVGSCIPPTVLMVLVLELFSNLCPLSAPASRTFVTLPSSAAWGASGVISDVRLRYPFEEVLAAARGRMPLVFAVLLSEVAEELKLYSSTAWVAQSTINAGSAVNKLRNTDDEAKIDIIAPTTSALERPSLALVEEGVRDELRARSNTEQTRSNSRMLDCDEKIVPCHVPQHPLQTTSKIVLPTAAL